MPVIKKSALDLARYVLPDPREVEVEELGGAVIVHPLGLDVRLSFAGLSDGFIATALADAVRDAEGQKLMSAAQWEAFGARHTGALIKLANAVLELSGIGQAAAEAAEKNSTSPSSDSPSS